MCSTIVSVDDPDHRGTSKLRRHDDGQEAADVTPDQRLSGTTIPVETMVLCAERVMAKSEERAFTVIHL